MAYADQEMSNSRIVSIIIVALIHVLVVWLLISGLAISAFKEAVERVTTVDIEEPEEVPEEEPPPPPPDEQRIPPPYVPPPDLDIAMEIPVSTAPTSAISNVSNKPVPVAPVAPPTPDVEPRLDPRGRYNAFPDSEYPAQARRLGQEGQVILGILVQADNSVGEVKIVQSSGFELLDNAAVEWYRKRGRFLAGVKDGKPIPAWKTLAVTFKLKK